MTNYKVTSENQPVKADQLNAIFSTIYSPIVPRTKVGKELTQYKKNDNIFYVYSDEGNASIEGKLSQGLINKLKEYKIELSKN